jgi:outer membrane murein-binding lipoprotein Lpp
VEGYLDYLQPSDIERMNAETERLKAQNDAYRIQLDAAKASDAAKMTNLL